MEQPIPALATLSQAEKNFILHWADDKYITGHEFACQTRYYGPDLEENLALGALAQDHLGHARLLYGLLVASDLEIDDLVYLRLPAEYRNSRLATAQEPDEWAFWVIKGLLYAQAELIRCRVVVAMLEALPGHETWVNIANIIIQDDSIHLEHWQQWLEVLGRQAEGRTRLQNALDRLLPLGKEFFYSRTWQDLANQLQISGAESSLLLEDWKKQLSAILEPLYFDLKALNREDPDIEIYCGREGRHAPELIRMLEEAHTLYQSYPEAALGRV
jgi:ring-1,2-phenylacetyl-CoA epoxidase subunit PaaC